MDVLFILEDAAVHCNTSTLMVLRQVCLWLKQKTGIIIGISSHSSIGDELMTSIHDDVMNEGDSIAVREGWNNERLTLP